MSEGFDLDAARKAGASDDDITSFLATKHNFDMDSALKAGASKQDVITFLSQQQVPISGQLLPTVPGMPGRPSPAEVSKGFDVNLPPFVRSQLPVAGATLAEAV